MAPQAVCFYEFGAFRIDPAKRLLWREGEVVALTPKCLDILLALIGSEGQVISKDALMKQVWPDSFVEDGNLTYNISVLRKALGETANQHHYIVTVPGRGYQFVATVTEVWPDNLEAPVATLPEFSEAVESQERAPELQQTTAVPQPTTVLNRVGTNDAQSTNDHSARRLASEHKPASFPWQKVMVLAVALTIVALVSAVGYLRFGRSEAKQPIRKVAVLPLANGSGDPEMDYLSEGISESLINSLSQLPGVKVIARSSSFKYKGKDADPQEVARVLDVEAILIGRVTQRGDNLSIQVELMDARDKSQVWGEKYNRRLADLVQVEADIVRQIGDKLRLHLTKGEQQQLAKPGTTNPEAYELLLRGGFYARKGGTENRLKGIEFFNQAIALDPNYAQAYAALANAYEGLGLRPEALATAKKALELDENLAEAHVAMANLSRGEWDWATAEAKYQHAIELNPNLMRARVEYADYLSYIGRFEQALEEIKRARELDPLNQHINNTLGSILFLARRYDEALLQAKKTLELDNSFVHSYNLLGAIYAAKGMYREAITAYLESNRLGGDNPDMNINLGVVYAGAGERGKARAILKHLETSKEYVSPTELAVLYTSLGEREKAFTSFEKAYAAHDPQLLYLKVTPDFDPLRSDPRFQDLMERVGLPQ